MRVSDADRENTIRTLNSALSDGRLSLAEMDDRVQRAYSAVTDEDLSALVTDLPEPSTEVVRADRHDPAVPRPRNSVGVLSGFRRAGQWVVPARHTVYTVMGGGHLDLTDARFTADEITIKVVSVLGGLEIVVPDDATVRMNALTLIGAKGDTASGENRSGRPVIRIVGVNILGGVSVRRTSQNA